MSYFQLSPKHKFTLSAHFRGRNLEQPITNSCNVPYMQMGIDEDSMITLCQCEGWLPIPVGQVSDFNSLEEVWNSPTARLLQQNIDDKKFTWCAVNDCGIRNVSINSQRRIAINIDDSCNLQCPSCRREKVMYDSGPIFERRLADLNRILSWLEKYNEPIVVQLMSNGDPLASHIVRPLFKSYTPRSGQTFEFITNGLLIKKLLPTSLIFPHIELFLISIDAGSKDVYENVRRPGRWDTLIDNLDFLVENNKQNKTRLNFVLQRDNYKDLENFVNLCKHYNFSGIVQCLRDFGTWNSTPVIKPDSWTIVNGTFLDHNVLRSDHPEHRMCKETLIKVKEQLTDRIRYEGALDHLMSTW